MLLSWLHAKNIGYDVITDEELHCDGWDAINQYDAVLTGSHPEYHTQETLDALTRYRDEGGALHYLGGNGFYWRIARHQEDPGFLEIRRAEDGLRAWASEPGEYYNAFDGTYGGSFLYLQPIANTTTSCFYIDAHALTTGSGIWLDIEDSLTTAASKSLINIDYDK